jgi:hypothetical protein
LISVGWNKRAIIAEVQDYFGVERSSRPQHQGGSPIFFRLSSVLLFSSFFTKPLLQALFKLKECRVNAALEANY